MILDVGCGDIKRGDLGVDIKFTDVVDVIADAHYLPFRSGSFSGCYAYALLEHVDIPNRVLCEIYRCLKNEGFIEVLVPTDSLLVSDYIKMILNLDFKGILHKYKARGGHKWQYNNNSLSLLMEKNGFHIKKIFKPADPWFWGIKGKPLMKLGLVRYPHLIVRGRKRH